MPNLRYLIWVACLFLVSLSFGQKEDWQPIQSQDQQIKEVPGDPGAAAIQLYYADFINDNTGTEFFYHRIKILTEKGRKPSPEGYSDVEIPIPPGFSISDLKARTIHPDGTVIDFTGKPFEKILVKGKGVKFLAKTFPLPDVTVGSIVEYKYKLNTPSGVVYDNSWTIQHELFTVKESLVFKAYEGPLRTEDGNSQLSYTVAHLSKNPTLKGNTVSLEMENVPAFEAESFMPPESNFKPQVRFFYGGRELSSADKYWENAGRRWSDFTESFIGNRKEVREAAAAAVQNETDPEKRLRKLYALAQQTRNLSYERDRTEEEQKKESLKSNQNASDVLQRGYGSRRDITLLFVGLARASGFEASVLVVSDRSDRFFEKQLPDRRQLNTELVDVLLAGRHVYLDPGTRFCPFGFVRWMRTSTDAIKLDKNGGVFVKVPAAPFDKSAILRAANVVLDEEGSLRGDLRVEFKGGEALEHRLDGLNTDESGRKKSLEAEVKSWLANGAIVKAIRTEGWDATDTPLVAEFSVQVPSYASIAGKRLLLPSYLFQSKQKNAFKRTDRKYPVYFPYAFSEQDKVTIKLPNGYSLEATLPQQNAQLPYAKYQMVAQFDGTQLVTQRLLLMNGFFFDSTKFAELRTFFGTVQSGDEQQAVVRTGGGSNAKQGN